MPTDFAIDRDRATVDKGGLFDLIRVGWPQVVPSQPFSYNWHIGAICDHLEAISRGEIKNLIINVPPGTSKSLSVSVFWPVWDWIRHPGLKWIFGSYIPRLQHTLGRQARDLVLSDWFQQRWPEVRLVGKDPSVMNFNTTAGGYRLGVSVKGPVTGSHANRLVCDDPLKPQELTKIALESALHWWVDTMGTRQSDPISTARVIMMQRLHDRDLSGEMVERGGYEVLRLPMRYESQNPCKTSLGQPDPRTEEGELLDPKRFPEAVVAELERTMTTQGVASQLQQRPVPAGGNVFELSWLQKRYKHLPYQMDQQIISLDCTFKKSLKSDFVCMGVWARCGVDFYLCDCINKKMTFTETLLHLKALSAKWPRALTKLVESAANGAAVVDTMGRELLGLELVDPLGGKEARAVAVTPLFRNGNVYFLEGAPWLEEYVDQLASFPYAANDDMVDMTSQGLSWMLEHKNDFDAVMEAVRKQGGVR